VADLDGAVLHGIDNGQTRHDFAGRERLDLEFAVGGIRDRLAHHFDATEDGIERLRPAGRHTPLDFRI